MSTRLTSKGIPMVDSQSLSLILAAGKLHEQMARYLSSGLRKQGYDSASASVLNFLSTLECGVNTGSEIARKLGVSRQMVAKTVKSLCQVGYLIQVDGSGRQKHILFTERGEHLMSDARQLLADLDLRLAEVIEAAPLQESITQMTSIEALLASLNSCSGEEVG